MATTKTSARIAAASDAFTDAWSAGDMDRCRDVLVEALGGLTKASDVEALFSAGGIQEVVFGPSALWPEVAEAIVLRAQAIGPAEGAKMLGWCAVLMGFSPLDLRAAPSGLPGPPDDLRPLAAAVEGHVDLFRAWLEDAWGERRVAGAHLFAFCSNVTADDERMLASADQAGDDSVLATELLSRGVLHRRLGLPGDALRATATLLVGSASPVVRLAAAVALALLGDELSEAATRAIVDHVLDPVDLPACWRWTLLSKKSDALALEVLPWLRTSAAESVVRRLAEHATELAKPAPLPPGFPPELAGENLQTRAARLAIAATLRLVAFEGRGKPVPRVGLAVSDLDDVERLAAQAIAACRVGWPELGFTGSDETAAWLEGTSPHFRPLRVVVDGVERRWHFGRILGAVAFEGLDPAVAREAVLREPDADVAEMAQRWSAARVRLHALATGEEKARILDFGLSLLAAVEARGFDVDALYAGATSDRSRSSPDVGLLAIACLRAHPGELPERFVPLVSWAVMQGWWADELLAAFRGLSEPSRRAVLEAVSSHPNAAPYLAIDA